MFAKEAAPDMRMHYVHMVALDDPRWRSYLLFRDTLRAEDVLRTPYGELK